MNTELVKRVKVATCERGQRIVTIDVVTLVGQVAMHGVDAVWRQVLGRLSNTGHSAWRCRALVDAFVVASDATMTDAMVLGRNGVVELEALDAGDVATSIGTDLDVNEHALQVSAAMRFLQRHLEHVLEGTVPPRERSAVAFILHAAQWAT